MNADTETVMDSRRDMNIGTFICISSENKIGIEIVAGGINDNDFFKYISHHIFITQLICLPHHGHFHFTNHC